MNFFLKNFDFLRYFWHKNPNQALMPKVPKKVKILTNKKKSFFQNLKIHIFYLVNFDR